MHTLSRPVFVLLEFSWNMMAHGDAREGKWRGNWRMQWVASTLHTTSEHGVPSITTADAHTSAASSRLNWHPPADLNGLVRFAKRRNLVSARVSSHFKGSLLASYVCTECTLPAQVSWATQQTQLTLYSIRQQNLFILGNAMLHVSTKI